MPLTYATCHFRLGEPGQWGCVDQYGCRGVGFGGVCVCACVGWVFGAGGGGDGRWPVGWSSRWHSRQSRASWTGWAGGRRPGTEGRQGKGGCIRKAGAQQGEETQGPKSKSSPNGPSQKPRIHGEQCLQPNKKPRPHPAGTPTASFVRRGLETGPKTFRKRHNIMFGVISLF